MKKALVDELSESSLPGPRLFGLHGKTNRETGKKTLWGKNEFNSAFPASLLCYMSSKNMSPVYLTLDENLNVIHSHITVTDLFKIDPLSEDIYFSFEDAFSPYEEFVRKQPERTDLVIKDASQDHKPLIGLEVKLTALPDNTTAKLSPDKYSCEMVFRRPSILHLALSIATYFKPRKSLLLKALRPPCSKIYNWRHAEDVVKHTEDLVKALDTLFVEMIGHQEPIVVQPFWKTRGKRCLLQDDCMDVFIWSNLAFSRLFIDSYKTEAERKRKGQNVKLTRPERCVLWLARMLYEFAQGGLIDDALTAGEMAYALQTDKAFAISGTRSWKYLNDDILVKPRITKEHIKEIIMNGGQNELSPERRFDLAIVRTPGIFA